MKKQGAYILYLHLRKPLKLTVGSLGQASFPAGLYAYVGSARRGVAARIGRHRRLAEKKSGKLHWHIDYLLVHLQTMWAGETVLDDGVECKVSKEIASKKGVLAPVPGFGSSDCRSGCRAHLYLLPELHSTAGVHVGVAELL
jgi:Uri superfamily endonuclease